LKPFDIKNARVGGRGGGRASSVGGFAQPRRRRKGKVRTARTVPVMSEPAASRKEVEKERGEGQRHDDHL